MKDTRIDSFAQGPGPVLRLTVELRDGTWRVLGTTRVDRMTVPASQPLPAHTRSGRVTGLWFDVVDRAGTVLYRSILPEPVPGVEVHRRDGSISRARTESTRWGTDLRVPLLKDGARVRLFHVPGVPAAVAPPDTDTGLVLDLRLDRPATEA